MDPPCKSCQTTESFASLFTPPGSLSKFRSLSKSSLVQDAFSSNPSTLAAAVPQPAHFQLRDSQGLEIVDVAGRYGTRGPNCLAVGVAHGVRGAVVGSVFGGAMGMLHSQVSLCSTFN